MSKRALAAVVCALAVSACSNPPPASPPASVAPVVTIYAPTAVPPASSTAQPASVAASPTVAVVATASPAAGGTGVPALGPNVNPFTGIAQAGPIARRAVLVKLANTADIRPQTGLQAADVVVEHIMEGLDTRMSALYLTNAPTKVGSVRSCRLIDIELSNIFNSGLVCSGTSPGVKPIIRAATHLFDRGGTLRDGTAIISDFGPYECATCPMFRTTDRAMPHNLFANLPNAWKELEDRKRNQPSTFRSFRFDAASPEGGKPADAIQIGYKVSPASWKFESETGRWLRSVLGRPHVDAATGKQLAFDNVLVLQVPHVDTDIEEDVLGSKSIQIQLRNSGRAKLFRDGKLYEGTWKRDPVVGMSNLDLRDSTGKPLVLKPGSTWVQVVATGEQSSP